MKIKCLNFLIRRLREAINSVTNTLALFLGMFEILRVIVAVLLMMTSKTLI